MRSDAFLPADPLGFAALPLVAPETRLTLSDRLGAGLVGMGLLAFALAVAWVPIPPLVVLGVGFGGLVGGGLLVFRRYDGEGVLRDGVRHASVTGRGWAAWALAVVLTGYYVATYWYPGVLGGLVAAFEPLSQAVRGKAADQWFVYGTFYTLAVGLMGVRAWRKYRGHRYHQFRTLSVSFFQVGFAFALPYLLVRLRQPEAYLHYTWPLDYDFLFPSNVGALLESGRLGLFLLVWGTALLVVVTPILTYFYGKRWYCAWVCGCGGLAETAGDPFRHLADRRLGAWQIERWLIHGVLVFITVTTGLLWLDARDGAMTGPGGALAQAYGFWIGALFSGVVGVGFYPLMGARAWCRFGCPMAAILGIQQRFFSRFRITTNGGGCISCGNCSTACEMGIDVRHYAQRGQNVVRAACVGCGACATACPRGVLRLENGPHRGRVGPGAFVPESTLDVL